MTTRDPSKAGRNEFPQGQGTLGEMLQSLRNEKGLTGRELARRLGMSQATVSKIETGLQKPTMDYIVRFAAEIGLPTAETSRLLMQMNLSSAAREKAAELLSSDLISGDDVERQRKAVERFESLATVIRVFDPQGIPEAVQSEEYARTAIRLSAIDFDAAERLMKARLKRQKQAGKKRLAVVLTEGALRARICSCAEMVSQVERLKTLAVAERCLLGIIPWSMRLMVTIPPAFQIYDNDGTIVCVDVSHRKVCLSREKDVEVYLRLFQALERMALVGKEALSLLDRVIQDFKRLEQLERSADVPPVS
jgi:transcriptional regulator with XRE-family HTH domain